MGYIFYCDNEGQEPATSIGGFGFFHWKVWLCRVNDWPELGEWLHRGLDASLCDREFAESAPRSRSKRFELRAIRDLCLRKDINGSMASREKLNALYCTLLKTDAMLSGHAEALRDEYHESFLRGLIEVVRECIRQKCALKWE